MKHWARTIMTLLLLVFATGCASTTSSKPDMLAAAGFRLMSADTPQKQQVLATLQADKLTLITWKGKQFYVEPAGNNQAYVGTPTEYQAYQQLRLAKQMSNDNLMAAQLNQQAMYGWGSTVGAWDVRWLLRRSRLALDRRFRQRKGCLASVPSLKANGRRPASPWGVDEDVWFFVLGTTTGSVRAASPPCATTSPRPKANSAS